MRRTLTALWCGAAVLLTSVAWGQSTLTVVDEEGKPVEGFEVMIHSFDFGYDRWQASRGGSLTLVLSEYSEASAIDVIVRADGYASTLRRFQGPAAKKELLSDGAQIVLERGREVRLKLEPPDGLEFPPRISPVVYYPELDWRVSIMWQPENLQGPPPNFNMLNARAVEGSAGEYQLRLPRERREFIVAVHEPGWLRFFKAGPFTSEDCSNNELTVALPRPVTVAARLVWPDRGSAAVPFTGVSYQLLRQLRAGGKSYISVASETCTLDDPSLSVGDLAPGHYMMYVTTAPKEPSSPPSVDEINPGMFRAQRSWDLQSGESVSEDVAYVPFDAEAYRGERTARIHVDGPDGLPAAGKRLSVRWSDGHYGAIPVFEGSIPAEGMVVLEGISDEVRTEAPFGPYMVSVGGETLGFFRFAKGPDPEDFEFHLTPQPGDQAPDVELTEVESEKKVRLKELRGRLVFLEFWETGCGPCQKPIADLNELVEEHASDWKDQVAIMPVSLDATREIVESHVKSRGWTNLRHYWSSHGDGDYFADAARAFVVHGVPTALLIDRDGTIVWRGHPRNFDLAAEIAKFGAK